MFVDNLLQLEKQLQEIQVADKSVIQDRLNKMNEAYLKELELSGDVVTTRGQKSLLKKVNKDD